MEPLTPDQRKYLRDHLILNGILDDDLEAKVLEDFASDVTVKMHYGGLPFEEAFAKVKVYAAYQGLDALQTQYREAQHIRYLLKRDTVVHIVGLILASALLFALNRGEAFVEFWTDFGEGLAWASLCCLPFALWRVAQTKKALRELEQALS
jgi:hypothetical protein